MPLHAILASLAGSIGWLLHTRFGYRREAAPISYHGWPAVASAELGRAYAELSVRMCLEDVEAVTSGRVHPREIRSIASDPVLIQPGFVEGLLLGFGALLLLLVLRS